MEQMAVIVNKVGLIVDLNSAFKRNDKLFVTWQEIK